MSSLTFNSSPSTIFGPRVGKISLTHPHTTPIEILTPGFTTGTSRGVIPHLSGDLRDATEAIRGIDVAFETFLEHSPPIPILQGGNKPLHTLLGYNPSRNIVSMSIRDPADGRIMPANGNDHVATYSNQGAKKISPDQWRQYAIHCKPDITVALSDIPQTLPPHSQKRTSKSIDRSIAWLLNIISTKSEAPTNILVHLSGGHHTLARQYFSKYLMGTLHGKEAELIQPNTTLDQCVLGYIVNMVPLRTTVAACRPPESLDYDISSEMDALMKTSLDPLPPAKLRVAYTTVSPHEILHLIEHIGIDLFDDHWVRQASDVGIALDFRFPTTPSAVVASKRPLGHNLYDEVYSFDFKRFSDEFVDGASYTGDKPTHDICICPACSPVAPSRHIPHTKTHIEIFPPETARNNFQPPYTRAYIHHLLHTHEMSAHSLLSVHNLSLLDAFFTGIREVLARPNGIDEFQKESKIFMYKYEDPTAMIEDARTNWKDVEMTRGKGRMARERAKEDATIAPLVDPSTMVSSTQPH